SVRRESALPSAIRGPRPCRESRESPLTDRGQITVVSSEAGRVARRAALIFDGDCRPGEREPMSNLTPTAVSVLWEHDPILLRLRGEVTVTAAAVLHQVARQLAQNAADVAVCCEEVGRLDVAALQILLALRRELAAAGKKLTTQGL